MVAGKKNASWGQTANKVSVTAIIKSSQKNALNNNWQTEVHYTYHINKSGSVQ
jgi:hypothetical protein